MSALSRISVCLLSLSLGWCAELEIAQAKAPKEALSHPDSKQTPADNADDWNLTAEEAEQSQVPTMFGAVDAHIGLGTGSDMRPYELDFGQNNPLRSLVFASFFLARGGVSVPLEFSSVTLAPQMNFEFRRIGHAGSSGLNKPALRREKGFGFSAQPGLFLLGKAQAARWNVGTVFHYDRMTYNDAAAQSSWQGVKIIAGLNVGDDVDNGNAQNFARIFPVGHLRVGWIPSAARYTITRSSGGSTIRTEQGSLAGFDFEFGMGVRCRGAEGLVPDRVELSYGRGQTTYANLHGASNGLGADVRANSESFLVTLSYLFEPDLDLENGDGEAIP